MSNLSSASLALVAAATLIAGALFAAEPTGDSKDQLPWSFRPLAKPALPAITDGDWVRDDLDRFVLARLEQAGIAPSRDADRPTLIRRLAFDLTGLPPTEREVAAFVADMSPDDEALARVVDVLLDSPRYGERWGRHWLDVVRYGDSTGRAWNAPLTYAWRYRDYVIDSLNADKPLDRFITEQLAGDLLPAESVIREREHRIATGFLALGSVDLQSLSHEQFVLDVVDDQIDVTTRALLGLSVACARCHDHKYDPVTMRDYYALAGIFYSTRALPGVAHQREFGREGYVHPSKLQLLPAAAKKTSYRPAAGDVHSMEDYQNEWRSGKRNIRFATHPDLAMGAAEGTPRDCEIRLKGEPHDRGDAPRRGDLRIPGLPRLEAMEDDASGRLQLARWIVSDENPLTARVLANRIWLHLFGAGLVRTVDDFGANSEPPTHPELLDHLAIRLREGGWSQKALIRAIVTSRTYRQSSASRADGNERDPQNELLWRMNLRRLELEPLRDTMLEVAGRLDLHRPEGIQVAGIGGKSRQSQATSLLPLDSPYRTIYLPVIRARLPEEYGLFDFPDPCLLLGQREVTTVAPQALYFMNSDFAASCARQAAAKLIETDQGDAERAAAAYGRVLRRKPTADELADALQLLADLRPDAAERDPELYRWSVLVQALFATAEFRYVR